jgi:hypothetical protein
MDGRALDIVVRLRDELVFVLLRQRGPQAFLWVRCISYATGAWRSVSSFAGVAPFLVKIPGLKTQ